MLSSIYQCKSMLIGCEQLTLITACQGRAGGMCCTLLVMVTPQQYNDIGHDVDDDMMMVMIMMKSKMYISTLLLAGPRTRE